MPHTDPYHLISTAFSRQAPHYDIDEAENEILKLMRHQVRQEVLSLIKPDAHILEINAGTGLDATFFARQGYNVTATDVSNGMVKQLHQKVKRERLEDKVKVIQTGFHELTNHLNGKFDFVFSNMGGLNCAPDLTPVFLQISKLIKPAGFALLVIMPPVCPWEIASVFKGKWRRAFRRLRKGGTIAQLEGVNFPTYYFSQRKIRQKLPEEWRFIQSTGLGALLPLPHMVHFPQKHPVLFRILKNLDFKSRNRFPFNRWADHIVVTLQHQECL